MNRDAEQEPIFERGISRRRLLIGGARYAGLAAVGGLTLASCGGSSSSSSSSSGSSAAAGSTAVGASTAASTAPATAAAAELKGKITMINYPEWMGKDEVAGFQKAFPGVTVKQVASPSGGSAAQAAQIIQNKGSYDLALAGNVMGEQLKIGKVITPLDPAAIPNLANVPENFRTAFPYGIPTDLGKVGIGYRSDLVATPPTSWADFFAMVPKYSGKVILPDYDVDVLSIALLALGFDINTTDAGQLGKAKDLVVGIKPHIKAFLSTDTEKPLVEGSAAMTVFYDYNLFSAQSSNAKVHWVAPKEGMPAYIDGWVAIGESKLPEVEAFMNYHLEPKVYADFINTTGAAFVLPGAAQYIDPKIRDNEALKYDSSQTIVYEKFLPANTQKLHNQIWEEIKAA